VSKKRFFVDDYQTKKLSYRELNHKFMSSSAITLQEFISPVASCPQDASLETLITEVKSSQQGFVAIVDQKRSPLGIVDSQSLLELLSTPGLASVTSFLAEQTASKEFSTQPFLCSSPQLIMPTVIVSSQQEIRELLPHLKLQNSVTSKQQNYLIVDQIGQLLGTINTKKLLSFLLAETKRQSEIFPVKKDLVTEDLYRLLDKIALPIILKSKTGKTLYRNLACDDYRFCPKGDSKLNSSLHNIISQPSITKLINHRKIIESSLINEKQNYQKSPVILAQKASLTKIEKNLSSEPDHYNYLKLPLDFSQDFSLESNSFLKGSWLLIAIKDKIIIENKERDNNSVIAEKDLVKVNQWQNEFLLNLEHDLKSPLTAIIGLSSLLKAEKLGKLNNRQIRYIDLIYRSGQKLRQTLQDLLEMSRVSAGKSEIKPESIAIANICQSVQDEFQADSDVLRWSTDDSQENPKSFNPNSAEADENSLNNLIVLIIATAPSFSENISNQLQKLGYHPIIASSLEDSWDKACHLQPGKILLHNKPTKTWHQDLIRLLITNPQTQNIPVLSVNSAENIAAPLTLTPDSLLLAFPPVVKPVNSNRSLTILRLFVSHELEPDLATSQASFSQKNNQQQEHPDLALDFVFSDRAFTLQHRIIEADSLEQAHILARIWEIDAIILDGTNLGNPLAYLLTLQESDLLSSLPLITLDAKTTEAANQIPGLAVFPCLVPPDARSIAELIQVIQIATRLNS
jgi:hypothetical protein